MTTTDWRKLCERLTELLELCQPPRRWEIAQPDLIATARAALAQPEPEMVVPTDQELADAFAEGCRDGGRAGEPPFLGGARAVLARWGRPASAPATDDDMDLLVIAIQALRPEASPDSHDLAAVNRGTGILRRWLTARGMA